MRMPVESFTPPKRGASDGGAARPTASVARSMEDMRTPHEMGEQVLHPIKRDSPRVSLTRSARGLQPLELRPHRIRGRADRGLGGIAQRQVVLVRSNGPFPVAQLRRQSPFLAQARGEERLPAD